LWDVFRREPMAKQLEEGQLRLFDA
jgi:hypothetical protein